ncbi:MAG: hypothetical protein KatS3mg077_3163 [Candidatus Binatia bacterium]|nr:MAG: hypothetical protein KatS3mg077_3163 [Candidatus Binatia bacterium]
MHITMVKKRLADGSECRKCREVTELLQQKGLWSRMDEVVWADERDPASPGMQLAEKYSVERAPFFIVRDDTGERVYTSVLQLIRNHLGEVTTSEQARVIDPDEVGGI